MITLHTCTTCGHTVFPARQLCHRCGGSIWTNLPCGRGVIDAVTMPLAEIRTPHAVRVIARLEHALPPGASVALHETEDGALWGSSDAD